MLKFISVFMLVAMLLTLTACGQKGELYLPSAESVAPRLDNGEDDRARQATDEDPAAANEDDDEQDQLPA
ncbi:MAG: lipoprotein [Gammaproteobacteria bacterium]|jgi:predicted small lipoprotein YifL|nr:lipoprotein [Gammaproteobacteria bacterium]